MTEIFKTVSFLIVVGVLVIGLAGLTRAEGVPPPVMGHLIVSTTDIVCEGTVTEDISYEWTYGTGDFDAEDMTLSEGAAAQINYSEDLVAIDGEVQFMQTFVADTSDAPNLEVSKNVVYVAEENPGGAMIHETEEMGLSVVDMEGGEDNDGSVDMSSICPWQQQEQGEELVSCIFVDAESSVSAKELTSHTEASVQTTESPSLEYDITATGSGNISAGMRAHSIQGENDGASDGLIEEVIYRGYSGASGDFIFIKSMLFAVEG